MMLNTAPVAVLDSGIGGIGVLRELKKVLPYESFIYFGDSANAPYGEKTSEDIRRLVCSIGGKLLCRAKALVLACNTATAVAAEELRHRFAEPIIGMEPALRPALCVKPNPFVLVLATETTLRERKFQRLLLSAPVGARVLPLPAPGLVRFAEAGITRGAEVTAYLSGLLAPLKGARPDAVVLGCTHFPLFKTALTEILGGGVCFFDGAEGTARETARRLSAAGLYAKSDVCGEGLPSGRIVFASSDPHARRLLIRTWERK